MIGALEVGVLYGVMALGVYLTFRVLNFPDLTVDGSFTTGAATSAMLIVNGVNPLLATCAGALAGFIAGAVTGVLHAYGKINGLLAGILTMIALWSVNLKIMGKANQPLLRQDTLFTPLKQIPASSPLQPWVSLALFILFVLVLKLAVDWFLSTNFGLAVQATGDNESMIRSFGVNTNMTKVLTLAISNGFVGLCGALVAQYQGFADISMGVGIILIGLASVILGQVIIGKHYIWQATLAVLVGAVLYRVIIFLTLYIGFDPNDVRAITAVLVLLALLLPKSKILQRLISGVRRKQREA